MFKKKKQITVPDHILDSYGFAYRMSYEEAYDAFRSLSGQWSYRTRKIVTGLICIIAAAFLVCYMLDNTRVHYFFVAILAILLLFYLVYVPNFKAGKGAKQVARTGGTYKVTLTKDGHIRLPGKEPVEIAGDKNARAIETKQVFAIRTDPYNTFCLPKRIMKDHEIEEIRLLLSAYVKYKSFI